MMWIILFSFFAGFVPTFGPAFIHLYGSTRDYNFIDEHSNLNDGLGEGVSYRGRIMIALKTDISDSIDTAPSEVEVMATQTINEVYTYAITQVAEWVPRNPGFGYLQLRGKIGGKQAEQGFSSFFVIFDDFSKWSTPKELRKHCKIIK